MAKRRNWRDDSLTWAIAETIVGKEAKDTAKRNVQLKVVYPLVLIVLAATIVLFIGISQRPRPQECQWAECHCYEGYDAFGEWHNDNPHHYHCTVHGDGHDCY